MAVRSIINQYLGINAHLHSLWQSESGWDGFHARHIVHLADTLKAQLIPMGYTAEVEESLQIRRLDDSVGKPRADVLISDLEAKRPSQPPISGAPAVQTMTFAELLGEDELSDAPFRAVAIRERKPETVKRGDPVAWIELLSPSNKGDSHDADLYQRKRLDMLIGGLVFVEIDYLHESPPTFSTILDYSQGKTGAHPYRIIVIDPRPVLEKGPTLLVSFDVDKAIPKVKIPLNAGEALEFDFGVPYRKTFQEALYGYDVDYRHLPLNFDRYQPADQTHIAARMLRVLKAAQQGLDLEQGSFPVEPLPLAEALRQIETFTAG